MHRKRPRLRRTLALLASALLAGATLSLAAPGAGAVPGPEPRAADQFQQVTLAKGVAETGEPMSLAVLPDRSVLHTARDGTLRLHRRGRHHQGRRHARRLHPRRGGPAGRRRSTPTSPPTATSTSTTRRR